MEVDDYCIFDGGDAGRLIYDYRNYRLFFIATPNYYNFLLQSTTYRTVDGFDPNTFPDPKITLSVKYPSWEHNKVITLGLLARDLVNPVTGTPELYNRYNVDFQQ